MIPHEFATKYGHTLHTDPETDETYLKLPVIDLIELGFMQESLMKVIELFSQVNGEHWIEYRNSLHWLNKILLASYPRAELDGLTELLEQENAVSITMFTQKQLENFSILLNDRYGLKEVTQTLSLAIEMLHYLEKDTFKQRDIQNVAAVIRDITVILEDGTLE